MASKLFEENRAMVMKRYEEIVNRKNVKSDFYNGIYDRYEYPVLTRDHIPPFWKFDMNPETTSAHAWFSSGLYPITWFAA